MSCGPGKFGNWIVPDSPLGLKLGQCCKFHDSLYQDPMSFTRRECDQKFLECMQKRVRQYPWVRRAFYFAVVWSYYLSVRAGGWRAWKRSRNQDQDREDTHDDSQVR